MTTEELIKLPIREFEGALWLEDDDQVILDDEGVAWWIYTHEGQRVRTARP